MVRPLAEGVMCPAARPKTGETWGQRTYVDTLQTVSAAGLKHEACLPHRSIWLAAGAPCLMKHEKI